MGNKGVELGAVCTGAYFDYCLGISRRVWRTFSYQGKSQQTVGGRTGGPGSPRRIQYFYQICVFSRFPGEDAR